MQVFATFFKLTPWCQRNFNLLKQKELSINQKTTRPNHFCKYILTAYFTSFPKISEPEATQLWLYGPTLNVGVHAA